MSDRWSYQRKKILFLLYPFSNSVSLWLLTVQFLNTYIFWDVTLYRIQINQPRSTKNLKYLYISLFGFSCNVKLHTQSRSQVISESWHFGIRIAAVFMYPCADRKRSTNWSLLTLLQRLVYPIPETDDRPCLHLHDYKREVGTTPRVVLCFKTFLLS